MSESQPTIFILYNAKASILGKLTYGYKKLCAPADKSPCSACDLTHGGLKLEESAEWKATKAKIPATVRQLHQDELDETLQSYIKTKELRYPVVLGQVANSPLHTLLKSEDLVTVSKDHSAFLALLNTRAQEAGIPLGSVPQSSNL